jgi:hypothetical protein
MITICTWRWGEKYGIHYVRRLERAIARNVTVPYRFKMFAPEPEDMHLTKIEGCLARLRMFDPQWQKKNGIEDRLVSIDLDAIVTGNLDSLFEREEGFSILQGINTTNPNPFNGSLFMLRAGYRPDVWTDFSLEEIGRHRFHAFPDDQGWFHIKMPDAGAYGPKDGVYGFKKEGWPAGDALPDGAKLVAFPGWRDPYKFEHLEWVKQHWVS